MGGTSTDVGFCDGDVVLGTEGSVGDIPVHVPMIDLHTVGAGGGSIARVDTGGALKVGPASAGADPGPACYGKGGERPTVSDAHAVLGRLLPEHFLGGAMTLDREAARRIVADPLEIDVEEAASGILAIADATMARALKVMSVERGHDPAHLALVAFGGAGGLHACALAERAGIPAVVVPPRPGLLSAHGMLCADIVRYATRSLVVDVGRTEGGDTDTPSGSESATRVASTLGELMQSADENLERDGVDSEARELRAEAEMRYQGQSFELTIDWPDALERAAPPDEDAVSTALGALRASFEARHEERYGYRMDDHRIELVTLRVRGTGRTAEPAPMATAPSTERPSARERRGSRERRRMRFTSIGTSWPVERRSRVRRSSSSTRPRPSSRPTGWRKSSTAARS